MNKNKKSTISNCEFCQKEDYLDIFTKLCKNCLKSDINLDDEEDDEEW